MLANHRIVWETQNRRRAGTARARDRRRPGLSRAMQRQAQRTDAIRLHRARRLRHSQSMMAAHQPYRVRRQHNRDPGAGYGGAPSLWWAPLDPRRPPYLYGKRRSIIAHKLGGPNPTAGPRCAPRRTLAGTASAAGPRGTDSPKAKFLQPALRPLHVFGRSILPTSGADNRKHTLFKSIVARGDSTRRRAWARFGRCSVGRGGRALPHEYVIVQAGAV